MTILTVNNVDKSDYITGLSSFRYEINKDFTFELPDLDIESAIDIGNVNDIVKISNSTLYFLCINCLNNSNSSILYSHS